MHTTDQIIRTNEWRRYQRQAIRVRHASASVLHIELAAAKARRKYGAKRTETDYPAEHMIDLHRLVQRLAREPGLHEIANKHNELAAEWLDRRMKRPGRREPRQLIRSCDSWADFYQHADHFRPDVYRKGLRSRDVSPDTLSAEETARAMPKPWDGAAYLPESKAERKARERRLIAAQTKALLGDSTDVSLAITTETL